MEEQKKQTEEVAKNAFQHDEIDLSAIDSEKAKEQSQGSVKNPFKKLALWWKKQSKKKKVIVLIIAFLVLAGVATGLYFVFKSDTVTDVPKTDEAPIVTTVPSKITGAQVEPEINERHATGVMIENSPDARPQSGLNKADLVYEAISEGGITRFLAIYHDEDVEKIGPIRSARPYYLDFVSPWDAGYAHVGGSPDAIKQIKNSDIKDLDQFFNSGAFYRADNRFAPHNVYSSTKSLDKLEKDKDFGVGNPKGFVRNETKSEPGEITAEKIKMDISSANYNSAWTFIKESNAYQRTMAGQKHVDAESAKQIEVDVVIGLVMNKGISGQHTTYVTTGSGKAFIYQSGTVVEGTWKKSDRSSQFTFVDANGETIKINPGKVWITIADSKSQISHTAAPVPKTETTEPAN